MFVLFYFKDPPHNPRVYKWNQKKGPIQVHLVPFECSRCYTCKGSILETHSRNPEGHWIPL